MDVLSWYRFSSVPSFITINRMQLITVETHRSSSKGNLASPKKNAWEFLILQSEVRGTQGPTSASHQSAARTHPYGLRRRWTQETDFSETMSSPLARDFSFPDKTIFHLLKSRLVAITGEERYRWCLRCSYRVEDLHFTLSCFCFADDEVGSGWIWF